MTEISKSSDIRYLISSSSASLCLLKDWRPTLEKLAAKLYQLYLSTLIHTLYNTYKLGPIIYQANILCPSLLKWMKILSKSQYSQVFFSKTQMLQFLDLWQNIIMKFCSAAQVFLPTNVALQMKEKTFVWFRTWQISYHHIIVVLTKVLSVKINRIEMQIWPFPLIM